MRALSILTQVLVAGAGCFSSPKTGTAPNRKQIGRVYLARPSFPFVHSWSMRVSCRSGGDGLGIWPLLWHDDNIVLQQSGRAGRSHFFRRPSVAQLAGGTTRPGRAISKETPSGQGLIR